MKFLDLHQMSFSEIILDSSLKYFKEIWPDCANRDLAEPQH